MTVRLFAATSVIAVGVLTSVTAPSASPADSRIVPCGDVIDHTTFPYLGDSRNRYRQVLGVVSVPPAYMQQVIPTNKRPWAYWHKQGLVVLATGEPVTVTVPPSWRTRAAISWGNSGGIVNSLRIAGCSAPARIGDAYAGGFYLRGPSACVPLTFTVGNHSATVRFGLGQRCHL
jgi:hypothetical protein